jgi:hypothetical protein
VRLAFFFFLQLTAASLCGCAVVDESSFDNELTTTESERLTASTADDFFESTVPTTTSTTGDESLDSNDSEDVPIEFIPEMPEDGSMEETESTPAVPSGDAQDESTGSSDLDMMDETDEGSSDDTSGDDTPGDDTSGDDTSGDDTDPGSCGGVAVDVSSFAQASACGQTTIYNGQLFECITQYAQAGDCNTLSGVWLCQDFAPDNNPWGPSAWKLLRSCP